MSVILCNTVDSKSSMMQPIVNGYTGVQSPLDGAHAGVLSPPPQLSPQPVSPSTSSSMACGVTYSNERHAGSTHVTHMANGALMTRTMHMAPTSVHVRGHNSSHGRRHATLGPYPYSLRGGADHSTNGAALLHPLHQAVRQVALGV